MLVAVRASNDPHTQQPHQQTRPPLLTPNILTSAPAGVRAHRISLPAAPSTALKTARDLYYRYRKTSACAHPPCSRELHPRHTRIDTLSPTQQALWASKSTCIRHTRTPQTPSAAMATPATARRTESLHGSECFHPCTGMVACLAFHDSSIEQFS